MTEDFLNEWSHLIDWVGLSIDASTDEIHTEIGRGIHNLARDHHLELAKDAWARCKSHGIRMKLNTVVCKPNVDDDMSDLALELMPERWKIFQVLPEGQNDGDVDPLLIENHEFENWVLRHEHVLNREFNSSQNQTTSCTVLTQCLMHLEDSTRTKVEVTCMGLHC